MSNVMRFLFGSKPNYARDAFWLAAFAVIMVVLWHGQPFGWIIVSVLAVAIGLVGRHVWDHYHPAKPQPVTRYTR